jgi:hypothetical protein
MPAIVQATHPHPLQVSLPAQSGQVGNCLPLTMLLNQSAQRFLDRCLLGRETGGGHGFSEQLVVNVDVCAHDLSMCIE